MKTDARPVILMTDWGEDAAHPALIDTALEQGYDGVEAWWPEDLRERHDLATAVDATGAVLSLLIGSADPRPQSHIDELDRKVRAIAESGVEPVHVTLHAGRDFWDGRDQDAVADWVREARHATGLDILIELHRARVLFAAHHAERMLRRHSELRVAFDISHWLAVAESMLDDQPSAVNLAIARADHIHARIGHPQGPQVNDPEAPEWHPVVEAHLRWWDRIVERLRSEGKPITFLAEFGPPDYAPAHPRSGRPLRDPRSSNLWMQRTLRERYGQLGRLTSENLSANMAKTD